MMVPNIDSKDQISKDRGNLVWVVGSGGGGGSDKL